MNKRIKYIDIAKAFAIIYIVLGHTLVHSANCTAIYKMLYSFHVVLFFILSGYTFQIKKNEKFLNFIKNKFIRIMIPYFIWSFLFLIPYMLLGKGINNSIETSASFNLKEMIVNILYGNGNSGALRQNSSLWFLPTLFSMEVIYYNIIKISKNNKKIQ